MCVTCLLLAFPSWAVFLRLTRILATLLGYCLGVVAVAAGWIWVNYVLVMALDESARATRIFVVLLAVGVLVVLVKVAGYFVRWIRSGDAQKEWRQWGAVSVVGRHLLAGVVGAYALVAGAALVAVLFVGMLSGNGISDCAPGVPARYC